jgi:hypothetical protein
VQPTIAESAGKWKVLLREMTATPILMIDGGMPQLGALRKGAEAWREGGRDDAGRSTERPKLTDHSLIALIPASVAEW